MRERMLRAKVPQARSARTSKDGVETFVVRIYRNALEPADEPAGTVERIGCGGRQGFVGRDELWDLLFLGGRREHERPPPDSGAARER
jgi:hypothetical protein